MLAWNPPLALNQDWECNLHQMGATSLRKLRCCPRKVTCLHLAIVTYRMPSEISLMYCFKCTPQMAHCVYVWWGKVTALSTWYPIRTQEARCLKPQATYSGAWGRTSHKAFLLNPLYRVYLEQAVGLKMCSWKWIDKPWCITVRDISRLLSWSLSVYNCIAISHLHYSNTSTASSGGPAYYLVWVLYNTGLESF